MEKSMEYKNLLLDYAYSLQKKYELSSIVGPDHYDPGNMENLDQYQGLFDGDKNVLTLKTEVKGLRYEGRTLRLDSLKESDFVCVKRDQENIYNPNNFLILNQEGESLGTLSADFCNVLAPLYDGGFAKIEEATASYIERLSERSRYAKQGILFVKIVIRFIGI